MAYELQRLAGSDECVPLNDQALDNRIERLLHMERPRYRRLWAYYRNPMTIGHATTEEDASGRPYRQAQEWGLPSRITGVRSGSSDWSTVLPVHGISRKEVVIENDIGWRIETMVDYLFGKHLVINAATSDVERRELITELIGLILENSGGVLFLQQLALLGAVYGFVDVLVKMEWPNEVSPITVAAVESKDIPEAKVEEAGEIAPVATETSPGPQKSGMDAVADRESPQIPGASHPSQRAQLAQLARLIRLEIVEPARALPFLSDTDYRVIQAYGQRYEVTRQIPIKATKNSPKWWDRMRRWPAGLLNTAMDRLSMAGSEAIEVVELLTADRWQRYEDGKLVAEGMNSLGEVPVVHIQNTAVPFEYSGASDVEPLIPIQDELNTRLSDRAHRITMQSFKMYLGRGIENFTEMPVAPGRMWTTDNPDAQIIEFGGDANSPSEDRHIEDLREAMDKASGVSPVAAGAIKNRIGRLTSAAALRVTLMALLAKTDRKRTTYGAGIERICELALAWLDKAGLFHTTRQERQVEMHWPSPLPENELEKLEEAEVKARLGVPKGTVLRELGY